MDADTLSYWVERYPLLITKLYIPRLDTKLLARPHLLELLDRAVNRPLVLITAPAGWGKTTLIANWARQAGHAVGWISLDEGDNDLARFWLHLIASLQQIRKGVGETALSWFYMPVAPPVEARLAMLINDLALAGETFVLVIDDIHCILSPVAQDSLTYFIEHLPPNVHLILTSRTNPLLPLARWRAGHRLVELDSHDLRFSPGECMEFLHKAMGLDLTPEQIAGLVDRTEGWIAGIQLVALALQGTPSPQDRVAVDDFIAGLGATSRYIFDYLSEEVLARQEPEIQEFLLKTSVLERLSGDLCKAVSGIDDSQRILEMLAQIKLFIVSLDPERRWFRYHHLFRDFLFSQLALTQPDAVTDLHRKAAKWYAANDLPYDALPHAMLVKDYNLAGRIIMQYGNDLWRREEFTTLRTWLGALPLELRERHPDLCLFHAWSLFRTLGLDEMLSMLTRAEALLDQGAPPLGNFSTGELRGILATIQGAISALRQDLDPTVEFVQSALALLPPEQQDWRYAALVGAGLAHHYHNNTYAAVQAFEEAFKAAVALKRGAGNFYGRSLAISWLARLYMVRGYLQRAKEIYQEALVLATGQTGKPLPTAAWALTGLGELYYQWNDLELAEKYFNDSLTLSSQFTPSTAPPYIPMVHLAYARGELRTAEAYLTQAVQLAEKADIPSFYRQVSLCQAWLALQRKDLNALEDWIQQQELDFAQPTAPREAEYVTAARILIIRHDYHRALDLVEKLLAIAEEGGRGWVVIELLILQSLALQGQDRSDSALTVLQRAITLASHEGYVRVFIDEGEPMLWLLRLFVARHGTTDYTARLLNSFTKKPEPPDALNERELDVLRLLATGMSNKQIAEALFITVGTVKWHANHIYTKLGVKNRGQAVAKARELQLISNSTNP
jgi:LuxR family transcriptional regulator, maltose regulon positive regulatory protein